MSRLRLVTCADLEAGTYEEVIALRDHSQNAFLAIGYDSGKAGPAKPATSLTAMTIQSGLLNIDVTLETLPHTAALYVVERTGC